MQKAGFVEFKDKFHIHLNQQQWEAVCAVEGPVLLLAVPGSGKTTVLVTRLGYMTHCAGIASEKILTVTYTVAAARDMAERFGAVFGDELKGRLEFRTINGICARVIRYYGNRIGKTPFSLVTENEGTSKILADIYRMTQGSYATEGDLKGVRTMITYIKNMMLTGEEIKQLDEEAGFKISEIYKIYSSELQSRGWMDYDDQMVYARNILRKSPETLQYFQNKYEYICVDEAQDTSRIQHEIIRLLAGERDNLFMVGDEDQSIYGFRAAYPEALLSFEKNHPSARVLLMEINFRSDGEIVKAADRFIQKNSLRHEKHMTSAREAETEIQTIVLKNRSDQYQYLARIAEECGEQAAVLYRNNESVLPLVDLLERKGISYRLHNGELTFFTHRIVQDIRNIICFALNPKDTELFLQIYYKISTYISKQDALRICEISRNEDREVLEAAIDYGQLPARTVQSCKMIRAQLRSMLQQQADRAVGQIVDNMGYGSYLERVGTGDGKIFILKAIAQNENSPLRLVERLDELQLIMNEKEQGTGERRDRGNASPVILSTIHSSKGLEYDAVYLLDVIDGVFPENVPKNLKVIDQKEREAYEEERRLFYVGVTRARNRLSVFKLSQKSSFCRELTYKEKTGSRAVTDHKQQTPSPQRNAAALAQIYAIKKRPISRDGFREFLDAIGEGLVVRHKKLGEGVIVRIQGDKVVIQFGEEQRLFELKVLYEYGLLELQANDRD